MTSKDLTFNHTACMKKVAVTDQRRNLFHRKEDEIVTARKNLQKTQAVIWATLRKESAWRNKKFYPDTTYYWTQKTYPRSRNIGGHSKDPYRVLNNDTRIFVIRRGPGEEPVNSGRVTRDPESMDTAPVQTEYATPKTYHKKRLWPSMDSKNNHWKRHIQRGKMEFKVEWDGRYAEMWEPRLKILEWLIQNYLPPEPRTYNADE